MKKKVLLGIISIAICFVMVGCSSKEKVVGTYIFDYENSSGTPFAITKMELYEGGTGKGFGYEDEYGSYPITWEKKDDIYNITIKSSVREHAMGYKLEDNNLKSVDGKEVWNKEE